MKRGYLVGVVSLRGGIVLGVAKNAPLLYFGCFHSSMRAFPLFPPPSNVVYLPMVVSHQASKRYLAVARSMKHYEDELYESWLDTVSATLPGLLKRTVLAKPPAHTAASSSSNSLHRLESWSGSRPGSRIDYSFLFPPSKFR